MSDAPQDPSPAAPPEPAPPEPAPPDEPRWRRVVRGPVPRVLLVIGVLLLALRILWARPVDVEVIYDYGPARSELVVAQMDYLEGGEALRRVRFDYGQSAAGRTEIHPVQLPRGAYTVRLRLTYRRHVPPALRGRETRMDDGRPTVTLDRPLRVRGSGRSTIVIAGE